MINEQGGLNGRKINLISLDDAYSPPKTVEQVRRLGRAGTGGVPVQYLSALHPIPRSGNISTTIKIPQLFVATGAAKWNDPRRLSLVDHGLSAELPARGADPPPSTS